ncbi:hypothetical protein [Glycomyces sp. YM15]|uniref:type IV toxin-antitoxin system AbiEi family antitoxin domain-containing protein n=1 Tax=Glycomyces sp. YM15 TaxID=2800446 RepID=UPI0019647843|nr:hypothetical protein [Glycomyces sp. YM15]
MKAVFERRVREIAAAYSAGEREFSDALSGILALFWRRLCSTRSSSGRLRPRSAWSRRNLTDQIPPVIDIAIPRGHRRPVTEAPVAWHSFDPETFTVGRTELELDEETAIGLYGPERSIIDAFRLRQLEGHELAVEAERWLRRPATSPAAILAMASDFPKARPALQNALEILL